MAIKKGTSLYSFQQEQFFKRMTVRDQLAYINSLDIHGVEIIGQTVIKQYPYPSEDFIAEWKDMCAEFDIQPVTVSVHMDVLRYRDHVNTVAECAEQLGQDLITAGKLGFLNVRVPSGVDVDIMFKALPYAEQAGVRLLREVHGPDKLYADFAMKVVDYVDRTGTKFFGINPDLSAFPRGYARRDAAQKIRFGMNPVVFEIIDKCFKENLYEEECIDLVEEAFGVRHGYLPADVKHVINWAGLSPNRADMLRDLAKYCYSFHGKIQEMTENPDAPGGYEDLAFDYQTPISILKEVNWDGYINCEFEGQRWEQDLPDEFLADEKEEVRRWNCMMNALLA